MDAPHTHPGSSPPPPASPGRPTPLADALCLAAFALVLLAPLAGRGLDPEADRSTLPEQRNPAPFPELAGDPLALPARFDAWLGDHYGFRGELVRWHNAALLLGLGSSPTERLVVGPGPWLFTTSNLALEAHRGAFQLEQADLEAWGRALEERTAWLAERGGRYLMVFAPGKPSVYGERLPPAWARGARTPLDQLLEYLAEHTSVEVLDLRPALLEARAGDRPELDDWLYYRLGTHWTQRGAWVAYRELLARLAPDLPGLEVPRAEDYQRIPREDAGDSWAGRLRLEDRLLQRTYAYRKRSPARSRALLEDMYEQVFETDLAAPRAVLLHDSFGDHLRMYLREDFARLCTRNSTDFELELLEREHPDVVIQLMAERRLASYRPPSSLGGDEAARAAFEAAGPALFALDRAAAVARLEPWRRAELTPAAGPDDPPLTVRLRRPGDGLLLPALELGGRAPVLRIDVESPEPDELAVFYQTPASPEYVSMRQVSRPIPAGRSVVHLDLAVGDVVGRLLILPGRARGGEYVLRGLELRARPLER